MGNESKMMVVCSPVGGVGRTTIAINLSAAMALQGERISLIDGDLQFGDVAMTLNLQPTQTLKELAENGDTENAPFYFTKHESGLNVLAAPDRPEYADTITPAFFNKTVDSLQSNFEHLVIDTAAGLQEMNLELMEKADEIIIVTTPGMHVLKNTKLMIETLQALDLKEKITLIVNKSTISTAVPLDQIPDVTETASVFYLPYDEKHVNESLDMGIPLVAKHPKLEITKKLNEITDILVDAAKIKQQKKDSIFQYISKIIPRKWEGENR